MEMNDLLLCLKCHDYGASWILIFWLIIKGCYTSIIIFFMRKSFYPKILNAKRLVLSKRFLCVMYKLWDSNIEKKHKCYDINHLIFQYHLQFKLVNYHNICFASVFLIRQISFPSKISPKYKNIQSTQWFCFLKFYQNIVWHIFKQKNTVWFSIM